MTPVSPTAPLTDAERAWLQARAAALGLDAQPAMAAALAAGPDGRIVLSADPTASASAPLAVAGGVAFLAGEAHLAPGEALVVAGPEGGTVHVVLGRLSADAGSRVVLEGPVELSAASAALEHGSLVELIGKDGPGGSPGADGAHGDEGYWDGRPGGPGGPGGRGEDGPGGALWFGEIAGSLTVAAGGGNGGAGGRGGNGGHGYDRGFGGGSGGNGSDGGRGGDAGNGGSVVITFGKMAPGAAIHPRARGGAPGSGGGPGQGGRGARYEGRDGRPGTPGAPGHAGEAPVFAIRCRGDA